VLKARADAEAALASEAARKALDAANGEVMQHLAEAYAAYCQACAGISATPSRFSLWAGGLNWAGGPVSAGEEG
jgi:hypothetical protein